MNNFSNPENSTTKSCIDAISSYLKFLSSAFEVASTEEGCLIILPFQRSDGGFIEIEIMPQLGGTFRITDNGDTVDYLWLNGLNTKHKRVKQTIDSISVRYNVKLSDGEIVTFSNTENLGSNLHNIFCAVQDIGYLIYKREFRGITTFEEEVEKLIIENKINYEPDMKIKIRSAIYSFRFFVNGNRNILIQPLTATTPNSAFAKAERLSSRWTDIKNHYPLYKKTTVIEDTREKASIWEPRSIELLQERSDNLVKWTEKEKLIHLLKSGSK